MRHKTRMKKDWLSGRPQTGHHERCCKALPVFIVLTWSVPVKLMPLLSQWWSSLLFNLSSVVLFCFVLLAFSPSPFPMDPVLDAFYIFCSCLEFLIPSCHAFLFTRHFNSYTSYFAIWRNLGLKKKQNVLLQPPSWSSLFFFFLFSFIILGKSVGSNLDDQVKAIKLWTCIRICFRFTRLT